MKPVDTARTASVLSTLPLARFMYVFVLCGFLSHYCILTNYLDLHNMMIDDLSLFVALLAQVH